MQTATLVTEAGGGVEAGLRRVAVACDHGLTEFLYRCDALPWALYLSDWDAARMVVARHFAVERCGCTAALRLRYALVKGETSRNRS
jgi:hypothetical protein